MIWAFIAKIDQTVTVRGRLEPSGSVREVESPSAGVVSKVFVQDGLVVKQGQPLFDVDAKGLASRRKAFQTTLALFELQANALSSICEVMEIHHLSRNYIPVVNEPSLNAQLETARQQSQQFISRLEQIAARLVVVQRCN